jgi:hypothetical protein
MKGTTMPSPTRGKKTRITKPHSGQSEGSKTTGSSTDVAGVNAEMDEDWRTIAKLGLGWFGIWEGMSDYQEMPREMEAVGGMLAGSLVGDGCVYGVENTGGEVPVYETGDDFADDIEMLMIFHAGKFAIACMCGSMDSGLILPTAFGMSVVARIAEKLRDNLNEILRLARILSDTGLVTFLDIDPSKLKGWVPRWGSGGGSERRAARRPGKAAPRDPLQP